MSLNTPIRDDGEASEWQDWLVDRSPNQEAIMAEHEESIIAGRRERAPSACSTPGAPHLRGAAAGGSPMTLEDLAAEFGVSRDACGRSSARLREGAVDVKGTIARQEQAHDRALIGGIDAVTKPAATPAFSVAMPRLDR